MAKKSFKGNPALQFISGAGQTQESAPEGCRPDPRYVEKRSRRVQLVVQPGLYEKVKQKAQARGVSVNEYVHQVLEKAAREDGLSDKWH